MELALVPLLLVPATRAGAAATAAALLLFYAAAIAVNLLRGRSDIDCGCGSRPQPLSWWLLLRNMLLASGVLTLTLDATASRFVWSDLLIALPALFALCVLYQGAEQLLANSAAMRSVPTADGHLAQESHTGSEHER
jgi:hypothetical protein